MRSDDVSECSDPRHLRVFAELSLDRACDVPGARSAAPVARVLTVGPARRRSAWERIASAGERHPEWVGVIVGGAVFVAWIGVICAGYAAKVAYVDAASLIAAVGILP